MDTHQREASKSGIRSLEKPLSKRIVLRHFWHFAHHVSSSIIAAWKLLTAESFRPFSGTEVGERVLAYSQKRSDVALREKS